MGLFGFGRKDKVLDLSEQYRIQKAAETKKVQTANSNPFSFFDSTGTGVNGETASEETSDEKKRRLAKRIADMTDKTEDLSNQIYHLQQRLEVLEKKLDVRRI